MKVVVEGNQVEIAFEALQSPLEEIFFGAAPLKAKVGEFTMPNAAWSPWLGRDTSKQQTSRGISLRSIFWGWKEGQKFHVSRSEGFVRVHADFIKLFVWKETPPK